MAGKAVKKKTYKKKPNGKNDTGRPTDYKPEYCQQIIDYFGIETIPERLPTLTYFAYSINVDRHTLQDWAKQHPEFSAALTRAKAYQEEIWMQNSLTNKYNPQFSKFVGINVIGWKDIQKHEHTGEDGGPIEFSDTERAARLTVLLDSARARRDRQTDSE